LHCPQKMQSAGWPLSIGQADRAQRRRRVRRYPAAVHARGSVRLFDNLVVVVVAS
jgi:hypothetical protein